ncbi:hypothetical protein [Cellulomonas sp. S1-8]|uniref:hypothetical protein n=1 Tax=Cellulomonas sp. S1-8 TaxID=2904790 RepID=UPI0022442626|nr:hypothetical protein [Cellulomonas sp. S1-8]UZN04236.1 hypothetical protein OKX07_04670 [Cellulomonas sp. S1-8]
MSSAPRRPRRAVRPPGTVGSDESVLRSVLPSAPTVIPAEPATRPAGPDEPLGADPGSTGSRPASAGPDAVDDPWQAMRSADDTDGGWGREEPTSDDDRLRREKPPHW